MNEPEAARANLIRRHLRWGWWTLLVYLALGIALETLHGFKVAWYLDVGHETRRMLFTLAHAHGTVLALVHLAFVSTLRAIGPLPRSVHLASPCLAASSLLLPGGFFLGGLVVYGGSDPGPGIFLVPLGAATLLIGVLLAALAAHARSE